MEKQNRHQSSIVSVAAVCTNDADIIESAIIDVCAELEKHYAYFELLLIDNGSTDGTVALIQELQKTHQNIRLLVLSREYDNEIAMTAAIEHSIGDYVVLMNLAFDPPHTIHEMVEAARAGSDIVIAERQDRSDNPWWHALFASLFYAVYGRITGFALYKNASDFRLLSRRAVNALARIQSKGRYLKHFNALIGFAQTTIPYTRVYRREHQKTNDSFFGLVRRAGEFMVTHSLAPLRFATILGLIASTLNLLFILYVFIVSLVKARVAEGWVSTSLVNSTMFFFLFMILAVISEYVGRVLIETKKQPLYFIAEEYRSDIFSSAKNEKNIV